MIKRTFDFVAAMLGLLLLWPLMLVLGLLVKIDSEGPILFRQERVGRRFRPFRILKFRTMVHTPSAPGRPITCGHDARITRVGGVMRRLKLDELPQLINVLKGEMSLVGPRPEVPRYVEMFRRDYEAILEVSPGVTDLASISYRDESRMLGDFADPEMEYVQRILPDKIRLAKLYVRHSGILYDLQLILRTLLALVHQSGWSTVKKRRPADGASPLR